MSTATKPTKAAFERLMNERYGIDTRKWGNGRYAARKRPYGTYLRRQDPAKFQVEYERFLATGKVDDA